MPSKRRIARAAFASDPDLVRLIHLVATRKLSYVDIDPLDPKDWGVLASRLKRLPTRRERVAEWRRLRRES